MNSTQPPSSTSEHSPIGRHVLMELSGCCSELLNSIERVEAILLQSAQRGGATVISSHFHPFSPQGLSGVVVIAESHITIHTWPEHGYAAVDVFTCGDSLIADAVSEHIAQDFNTIDVRKSSFSRSPAGAQMKPNQEKTIYA